MTVLHLGQVRLDLAIHDKHKSGANSTQSVSTSTLEQSTGTLLLHNLAEAVHGALVHPLLLGLLGLHLETTADSVEWVRGISSTESSGLSTAELDSDTLDTVIVLELSRDGAGRGLVNTEVGS